MNSFLMYGCEAWTISKQVQKKNNWRPQKFGSFRECYESHGLERNNKTVLQEADTTRSIMNRIRKCQAIFFGHVMRREKLEHLVTIGMIEGKQHEKM